MGGSSHDLLLLGSESLRSLSLLDVLFKLFILLSSHIVHFFLGKVIEILNHLLNLLSRLLWDSFKCALDLCLPQTFQTFSALAGAIWLADLRILVLSGTNVHRIGGSKVRVVCWRSFEQVGHEEIFIELTR